MKRNERLYDDVPPEELLAEGAEPTILAHPASDDGVHRFPFYPGEGLPEALARARAKVPDAVAFDLQVYRRGRFHYAHLD
ncbi:hypothetical protein [Oceanithermus sp.]|uniref:hypothetical protein n=1 Tax=Oceanithermus sp. TaxID=2268145 RepID=UPI0025CE8BB6|nr:hypothetical protein [Oceanithermus sp.]